MIVRFYFKTSPRSGHGDMFPAKAARDAGADP